jgi:hypothetical protein
MVELNCIGDKVALVAGVSSRAAANAGAENVNPPFGRLRSIGTSNDGRGVTRKGPRSYRQSPSSPPSDLR